MGNNILLLTNNQKHPDFIPEQNVFGSKKAQTPQTTPEQNFLKSHVESQEFSRFPMSISNAGTSNSTLVLFGNGNLTIKLISYPDIFLMAVYFENHISLRFDENTVRLLIRERSFLLPNFMKLLNQEISEGDFKEDLVSNFPSEYREIWSVLTSGENFQAHYEIDPKNIDLTDYLTVFDLFKDESCIHRLRKNQFSGQLMVSAIGQVKPEILFEGENWSLSRVSFLSETGITATIDFSLLKSCFVLHLDGKSYNLPKYVEVLSEKISQREFKKRLYEKNKDDFVKLLKFLVDRMNNKHVAYYDRKW
jgi:hypothetical protein